MQFPPLHSENYIKGGQKVLMAGKIIQNRIIRHLSEKLYPSFYVSSQQLQNVNTTIYYTPMILRRHFVICTVSCSGNKL